MIDRRRFIGRALTTGAGLSASTGLGAGLLTAAQAAVANARSSARTPGATVKTGAGKVRGTLEGSIQVFKGIPYGASTAGERRFSPPARAPHWTGVREAVELGPRAPQLDSSFHGQVPPEVEVMSRDEQMSEDCLRLNVWTGGLGAAERRPVMVWLHGGGYTSGSGGFVIYDGLELARKHNVVLITVNHRLSALGYLYLAGLDGERYASASNLGNLDIIAALEWVHENVAAFGGDPGNVTIFGQSGGGGKVSSLMAMPAAKGLFHRAIVQSGAAVKGLSREAATRTAEAYMGRLNLKPGQVEELQKLPFEQLMAATTPGSTPPLNFAPVVDGRTLPTDPFDPAAPELSAQVPLLIGSVETEVTFFPRQVLDPIDGDSLNARLKQTLPGASATQLEQLLTAYRAGRPAASNTDLYLIIASDVFRGGVVTEAERKAAQGKAPVYHYYFTWRSPVREGKLRSFHTLEIPFVFDNVDAAQAMTGTGPDRHPLATRMASAWTAFARTGNPACPQLPPWPAFDAKQRATMIFDNTCQVVNDPHGEEQRLLRQILAA
jgi:para-nitrobenzyl esterase